MALPISCLFHGYFILQRQSWVAVTETLWAGAIVFIMLTHFAQSPILYSCILVNIVFFFFEAFSLEKAMFSFKSMFLTVS